jgi:hypothetical protein
MIYPQHLLPQSEYKIIDWSDALRPFYLLRSVPTADFWDQETDSVRVKYVNDNGRDKLKDYSVNLFGVFTKNDVAIVFNNNEQKAYFTDDWTPATQVNAPQSTDFQVLESFGCFYYLINTIQDFPQPFKMNGIPGHYAKCYVCHTPTNSNFWHFSVRWKIGSEDINIVLSVSQRKDLLGLVRGFLVENALKVLPPNAPTEIPEAYYKMKT